MGLHRASDVPQLFVRGVHKALDGLQFSLWGCTEPETSPNVREGGRTKPEAVGNFHHGGAKSLRRPAVLVNGEHRKRAAPETVGDFTMWVQAA